MTNNTPISAKQHRESTEPESRQTANFFSFLFFLVFRRASSNLLDSFTMVSAQNSSVSTEQCTSPLLFLQVWSLTRRFEPLTEELWLPLRCHFSSIVRMRTNHLATKYNCYARNTVGVRGVIEESLVWSLILQPILYRKLVRVDLLLCDKWQTSAQACICC